MTRLGFFFGMMFLISTSTAFSQVQTNALKKAERFDRKDTYRKLSDDEGLFLLPQFGMRYGNNPDPSFSGLQDLSLYYGLGLGYRRGNLSLESGLAVYHHTSSAVYFPIWEREEYVANSDLSALVLPFTFRYDIPTGEKENVRLGAFFTSNCSLVFLKDDDSRSGTMQHGEEQMEYSLTSEAKSPFFFKTGLHAKVRFLNSAFLNLEVGQFFALGTNRLYTLTLDDAPPREVSRKWEGLTWSVGAVVPIAVLEGKFRKKD
ncbi:hypothetical protein J0A68_09725 [Algoriphagus sp. H41]|uniref:Outer membrane protein beta-barrel domain-containing protein n=1 Tax=Algoriphagus oliviformis TaxID=2811231 RepID=A0ABS3C2C1_9BACT|nr:hypothetical protein [Algoriphagus oliviformis]MBN7811236.1 hypothetical protein [Algoriphagus oliviformis]